jgi:hypothetical protein
MSPQEQIELSCKVAYHVKEVSVRDNENKRTWKTSILANSPNWAKNWGILVPGHPKKIINSGILVPCRYGS